jgi:deazaflavin-dependent oxidoreductase (nitroreductase family)
MKWDTTDADRDFNRGIIQEFRANGGRVGGALTGAHMILIHHVGATSGLERVTPLMYTPQPDGSFVIVASNGGSAAHPRWYYNLRAHPRIEVEVGVRRLMVRATELEGSARDEYWPMLIEASPTLAEFATRTPRQVPVFLLTPEE